MLKVRLDVVRGRAPGCLTLTPDYATYSPGWRLRWSRGRAGRRHLYGGNSVLGAVVRPASASNAARLVPRGRFAFRGGLFWLPEERRFYRDDGHRCRLATHLEQPMMALGMSSPHPPSGRTSSGISLDEWAVFGFLCISIPRTQGFTSDCGPYSFPSVLLQAGQADRLVGEQSKRWPGRRALRAGGMGCPAEDGVRRLSVGQ